MSIGEVGGDFLLAKLSVDGIFDSLFNFGGADLLGTIGSNDGCLGRFSFCLCLRAVLLASGARGDTEFIFLGFGAGGISSKYC